MPGRTIAICLVLLIMQTSWDHNCCILLGFNFSPYGWASVQYNRQSLLC